MKAIITILFILIAILGGAVFVSKSLNSSTNEPVLGTEQEATPEEFSKNELVINLGENTYRISWLKVDPQSSFLYPNFEKKEVAKNLFEQNSCEVLVNGGFYVSDNEVNSPIGLFISEGETTSEYKENSLFNGILSVNTFGTPRITENVPEDSLVSAVQTGPILQENDYEHELSLARDKEARRMVAAVTGDNELIFLSIYSEGSSFYGPKLVDMPEIISLFETKANINIADAINLDGGAASALYSKDITISEASPIGSFWCVK